MDPLTQGILGGAAAQLKGNSKTIVKATVLGALSGMAADLDILIRSSSDPLLALQFHRHFTHSLLFIPFGGLICAAFFYFLLRRRWQLTFFPVFLWCLIGYATHALLDGCTSYGTQLFWPLTDKRFAWDFIAVIDPLFTLPALVLVVLAALKKSKRYTIVAWLWMCFYMSLGVLQHHRAIQEVTNLAKSRGHAPEMISARPTLFNLLVWKSVYLFEGHYYCDGVRVAIFAPPHIWQGESVAAFDSARDLPAIRPDSLQGRDIALFSWFANDTLAIDPSHPERIIDLRYSLLPHKTTAIFAIEVDPATQDSAHVNYGVKNETRREVFGEFIAMIFNTEKSAQ